mmetsp:Transcript_118746/g.332558  ORF Transcript_118746/g.332558 Transcript_118746/m.332558 type:complete len:207 (-) Transcript_118746:522-1142(-)
MFSDSIILKKEADLLRTGYKSDASSSTSIGDEDINSLESNSAASSNAKRESDDAATGTSDASTDRGDTPPAKKASERLTLSNLLKAPVKDMAEMYRGNKKEAKRGSRSIQESLPADRFDSTRVHLHGEEVWVEWSDDEKTSYSVANDVNFLSTAVHLDGQAIWDAWPQTDDERPVYIDASLTNSERRLRFTADTTSYRGALARRRV